MEGKWINNPNGQNTNVVFIHGILSEGETCWKNNSGSYWPELLTEEKELKSVGIYVFTYKTGFFSGNYQLNDVVDALKEHMGLDGLFESQRIVFVCHSMGGIVARKFIVERFADLIENHIEIGLFLVASPSLGSSYSNWLSPLASLLGHSQADALRFAKDNAWLNGLDKEFQNLKEAKRIRIEGKELVEDQFVVLKKLWRDQVVESFSGARYFGEQYKVPDSDHSSIAKPVDKKAIQHRLLCRFIIDFIADSPAFQKRKTNLISSALLDNSTSSSIEDTNSFLEIQPEMEKLVDRCRNDDTDNAIRELRSIIISRFEYLSDQNGIAIDTKSPKQLLIELTDVKAINQEALKCFEFALTVTSEILYDYQIKKEEGIKAVREAAVGLHLSSIERPQYKLFQGRDGGYSFTFTINDQDVFFSESYRAKASAMNGVRATRRVVERDRFETKKTKDGSIYYILVAQNGQIVGHSVHFTSIEALKLSIKSVKHFVPLSPLVETSAGASSFPN